MKFTISDCISRINQALNYPAITYEDVSHFFDQAISELNTSLRIALPTVTEMRLENTYKVSEAPDTVYIASMPENHAIVSLNVKPDDYEPEGDTDLLADASVMYYTTDLYINNRFFVKSDGVWKEYTSLHAVTSDGAAYVAVPVGFTNAFWKQIPFESVSEFSLTTYLPVDWIILFLIPYVCFKFAVRNGDNGALFSDEFTQGLQQLQTSYAVPNSVVLSTVAHLPAYKKLVEENLNNLTKIVNTRAVTEAMRIPNGVHKVYHIPYGGWDV